MSLAEATPRPAPESVTAVKPSRHIAALDGLRGVAILSVFLSHFGGGHKSSNFLVHLWSVVADAGWMGVDLFFVLSGFLITGILWDTAHRENRAKNFYARRALRIFPLFYGILFALLLLTPVLHLHWKPGHALYFFYLSNMIPVFAPHLPSIGPNVDLVHLWSLAVEEQFYLLWPFVVWFVRDRVKLLRISVAIMLAALALRIVLVMKGVDGFIVYSLLMTRADSLICGGALALLVRGPAADRLPVRWVLPVSGAGVIALFLYTGNGLHEAPMIQTIGYSVIAIFCACIIYLAQQGRGIVAKVGLLSGLRFFGRYSYGLYVYHGLLIVILFPLVYKLQAMVHSVMLGGLLYIVIALGLSLGVAMLSYHYFEAPVLRLKRYFD